MMENEIESEFIRDINRVITEMVESIQLYLTAIEFIDSYDDHDAMNFMDWLSLCGNIESVSVSIDMHDSSTFWCRPAYEYEKEKSYQLSVICRELTRFQFACLALESLMRYYNLKAKKGKGLTIVLAEYYGGQKALEGMRKQLEGAFQLTMKEFQRDIYFTKDLEDVEKKIREYKIDGLAQGILLVYKLRNGFAHGTLEIISQFSNIDEEEDPNIDSIILSCLIVLLNIIALLLTDELSNEIISECSDLEEYEGKSGKAYLTDVAKKANCVLSIQE